MKTLQDIFDRLQEKKKQVSVVRKKYQEELLVNADYQKIKDQMEKLREQKKKHELAVKQSSTANFARIDELALAIRQDAQMLSDIALTSVMKGESIAVKDQYTEYEPQFSVRFKKTK